MLKGQLIKNEQGLNNILFPLPIDKQIEKIREHIDSLLQKINRIELEIINQENNKTKTELEIQTYRTKLEKLISQQRLNQSGSSQSGPSYSGTS